MKAAPGHSALASALRWAAPRAPQLLTLLVLFVSAVLLASVRALHAAWYGFASWPWVLVACWLASLWWVERRGSSRGRLLLAPVGVAALFLRALPIHADPSALAVIPLCVAVSGLMLARLHRGVWAGAALGIIALFWATFPAMRAASAIESLPTAWRMYEQRDALCAQPYQGPGIEHLCEDLVCLRCTADGAYDYIVVWGGFDPDWMIDDEGRLY